MEMGKLTAKLRDAVPVCLLVESKEIKRYKNIEIPDELKKLEYQDFKFDVPLNGAITFKIMFEPGVLPEEFPRERERRTRKPMAQETEPQALAVDEVKVAENAAPLEAQPTDTLPAVTIEALAQALEYAKATGEPVADIAAAIADGETIKAKIVGDDSAGRVLVITAEPASTEDAAQPENDPLAMKPVSKGRGRKGAAPVDSADK